MLIAWLSHNNMLRLLSFLSCVSFVFLCDAEYTDTLLAKVFHNSSRQVHSFKVSSWKHMTAANLTTNMTEIVYDGEVDRFLQTRYTFRDDLCTIYDRVSSCHATQQNHTLRKSLQALSGAGKTRCALGLSAPHNYTTEVDLQRCLTQANVTSSCSMALQSCMEDVVKLNVTGISGELVSYDHTNDIALVNSIVHPVAGALIPVPVPAFIATMMCIEFVPGMTGAIEAGVMTGALVASLLGAVTLAVWEILRRIPWFQHRLHPTLQGVSNTSLLLR